MRELLVVSGIGSSRARHRGTAGSSQPSLYRWSGTADQVTQVQLAHYHLCAADQVHLIRYRWFTIVTGQLNKFLLTRENIYLFVLSLMPGSVSLPPLLHLPHPGLYFTQGRWRFHIISTGFPGAKKPRLESLWTNISALSPISPSPQLKSNLCCKRRVSEFHFCLASPNWYSSTGVWSSLQFSEKAAEWVQLSKQLPHPTQGSISVSDVKTFYPRHNSGVLDKSMKRT